MIWRRLQESLQGLLRAGDRTLVLGYSGGLDSTVLLHLLARYREACRPEVSLVAAHFHHGLRGAEADADAAFCRRQAEAAGAAFEFGRGAADAPELRRRHGPEGAARQLRYRFLHAVCARRRGAVLLLAHHADDQRETVLLNLARGAGPLGWAGMPACRERPVRTLRPLLGLERRDLRAYATVQGLPWREDRSNADLSLRRNRLRRRTLPGLTRLDPGWPARLDRFAAVAAGLAGWLGPVAASVLAAAAERRGEGLRLARAGLEGKPRPLVAEVLRQAARAVCSAEDAGAEPPPMPLSRRHVRILLAGLADGRTGSSWDLPAGLRARLTATELVLERRAGARPASPGPTVTLPALVAPPRRAGRLVIASRLVPVAEARQHLGADAQREFLDADRLRLPLRVRPVRPGDRFRPLGAPGRMLVSDFLTNAKVPRAARASALVVEDAGGIVWLWPHRLAERVRLRGESRRAAALTLRRLQPSSSGRGASSSSAARSSSASTGLTK